MTIQRKFKHLPLLGTLTGALLAPLSALAGQPVWLNLGAPAFEVLRSQQPGVSSLAQRQLPVSLGARSASDTVHLVRIDEDSLPRLGDALHSELRRCGGYTVHATRAEALASLDRLSAAMTRADAVAPSYAIDNQAQVQPLINQVQDSQILNTIQTLSAFQNRYYKTSAGVAASDAIANNWRALAAGRSDVSVRQVTHKGWPQKSVVLTIKGTAKPAEIVVMGAHLDSIVSGPVSETTRSPGADDDASGVASLTEVLRVMMANGYKPRRTIELMAYAAEEVGLRGSQAIANSYKLGRKKVVGVLQLDMTNYEGSVNDIYLYTDYTNAAQNTFVANLAATYLPTLTVGYDRCGYGCSDHASWTGAGFAASFPFESAFNDDNPFIHTANDTLANMGNQASHAAKFTKLALAFGIELGTDGPVAVAR